MKIKFSISLLVYFLFLNVYASSEDYVCIPTEINDNCASGNQHGNSIDYWEDDKTNYYGKKRLEEVWEKGTLISSTGYGYHYDGKLKSKSIANYAVIIGPYGYRHFAEYSWEQGWYEYVDQIKYERKNKYKYNKEKSEKASALATNNQPIFNHFFAKREWYKNGQMKSLQPYYEIKKCPKYQPKSDAECIDDPRNGKYTWWFENGQIKLEQNWKYGKLDGKYTEGCENGQLKSSLIFNNDKYDGTQRAWYENGQLKIESNMKDDKRHGNRIEWNEYGKIVSEGLYKEGNCISGDC